MEQTKITSEAEATARAYFEPRTDARELMEAARIALTFYRLHMERHAPARGLTSETYPYGISVEMDLRRALGEVQS